MCIHSYARKPLSYLLIALTGAPTLSAATIEVPAEHLTIQAAIDAAAAGDTIMVAAGTYRESLSWTGKDLVIQGAGAATTIIDPRGPNGERGGACVETSGLTPAAVFEGFTLRGGIDTEVMDPNNNPIVNGDGGGMVNVDSSPTVVGCVFTENQRHGFWWYNTRGVGGGMCNLRSNPTVIDCVFHQNSANEAGGMGNTESNPTVIGCTFDNNSDPSVTNFNCTAPGVTFADCELRDGLRGMVNRNSNLRLTNSVFTNFNGWFNQAIRIEGGGTVTLDGCLIADNTSTVFDPSRLADASGIGIRNGSATLVMTNCTVVGNRGGQSGTGVLSGGPTTITNCIFWDNEAYSNYVSPLEQNIAMWATTPIINHSNIEHGDSLAGVGNMSQDPMFVSEATGDYRLLPGSPSVDSGDSAAVPATLVTDLGGNARTLGAAVDIGAFEFVPCVGDVNDDGQRNLTDLDRKSVV